MVKFLHWSGEAKMSRSVCGVRLGVRRVAMMAIGLVACLYAGNANAQNWTGSTPANAAGKTVYLWNVGAKQFLGKGGKWGTEAVMSNVGTPFIVESGSTTGTYQFRATVKGHGSTDGYLSFMNKLNSVHDGGNYFTDRPSSDGTNYGTIYFTLDGTGANSGYTMAVTSKKLDNDTVTNYLGTFYMVAGSEKPEGKTTVTDGDAYSKWVIVTEDERKAIFEKAEASSASAVDATFLTFDEDFARNDNNVSYWKTRTTKGDGTANSFDGTLSWDKNTNVTPDSAYAATTYTYTYTGSHTYTYTYWGSTYTQTHNVIHTVTTTTPPAEQQETLTVSCGSTTHTVQNVEVKLTGYVENKKGYQYYNGNGYINGDTTVDWEDATNTKKENKQNAYGGDWTANIHGNYGVVNQTIPVANMVRAGWYKVSCMGFTTAEGTAKLYASAGLAGSTGAEKGNAYAEQTLKAISESERPATYVKASRLINSGNTYEASVLVYVGTNTETGKPKTLSFGVLVDGAGEKGWTCFDSFQVEYLGNPNRELVLDEEQTSVDYINNQFGKNADEAQRTLYLHRTVNANKWNSIVLPVSLTVGQVKSAFGDNTHVSEFMGAKKEETPGRMYFEAVNVDRNNNNAVAIEAGKLYIIKPTASEPEGQKEKTFDATGNKTYTSYFTIPQVEFPMETADKFEASVKEDASKNETFGKGKVQFEGTYVANAEGQKLIPENSYVLRGNTDKNTGLWFYRTKTTSTKGFRGWLHVVDATAADKLSFSINGVVDDATGIDGLTMDGANKAAAGIYNLNGQLVRKGTNSTEGLAKGIYVVGGRKVVVK